MSSRVPFSFESADPKVIRALFRSVFPQSNERAVQQFLAVLTKRNPLDGRVREAAQMLCMSCGDDVTSECQEAEYSFVGTNDGWRQCCLCRIPKAVRISIATDDDSSLTDHLIVLTDVLDDASALITVNGEQMTIAAFQRQLLIPA